MFLAPSTIIIFFRKGLYALFQVTLQAKMAMPDLHLKAWSDQIGIRYALFSFVKGTFISCF